jgi:hypothetical protein
MRILVVENEPAMSSRIGDNIRTVSGFDPVLAPDDNAAQRLIDECFYEVALIDLGLSDRKGLFEGLRLCEYLRGVAPSTVIVVYSWDIEKNRESAFQHYNECLRKGADAVLARENVMVKSGPTLKEWIDGLRKERCSRLGAISRIEWADDAATRAFAENVGELPLRHMLNAVLNDAEAHKLECLTPGFTGAYVVGVRSVAIGGGAQHEHVLKVSESRNGIIREFLSKPASGTIRAQIAVGISKVLPDVDGYAVAVSERVTGKSLLRSYLCKHLDDASGLRTLESLVEKALIAPAKISSIGTPTAVGVFTNGMAAEVSQILGEMKGWTAIHEGNDRDLICGIERYVGHVMGGYSGLPSSRRVSSLHGDFHTRNVFVADGESPVIIDYGRAGTLPRLFDIAALDADLCVTLCESGDGREFQWGAAMNAVQSVIMSQFPFVETVASGTGLVNRLRSNLLENMLREIESVDRKEYAGALAFQLLRYLRFMNVPAPRKLVVVRAIACLLSI